MSLIQKPPLSSQLGFTLIEIMLVIAIIRILSAITIGNYQVQVRQTHFTMLCQEMNHFRLPYQILMHEGAGMTDFSPNGLNMPTQTKYCQFSVIAPKSLDSVPNAIQCQIQNLSYLSNQTLRLDRAADGNWTCRASSGIARAYLPQACQ